MCGIVGYINCENSFDLGLIAHRGPDSQGIFEDGVVRLGHTRLSILDPTEHSNQPFKSACGNYVLVFNGEIYNHGELRNRLEYDAWVTTSDTETVLLALIELGSEAINLFNGIFSFAFYDLKSKELIIARDRFGVKPLYYGFSNNSLVFSSELKALMKWEYIESENLDYKALENYIRFLYSPGERSPLKSVQKLLPGKLLKIGWDGDLLCKDIRTYVENYVPRFSNGNEETIIKNLSLTLEAAVRRQLLADVPIGFFLSGGLDSSLIVAIVRKLNPDLRIKCFTIDTREFSNSEGFDDDLHYAKMVAKYLDVDLEIIPSSSDILKDFDKVVWHLDEPQADIAPLHVYNIAKHARELGFKVLIGGTAGDDLFSGYRRHKVFYNLSCIKYIPRFIFNFFGYFLKTLPLSNKSTLRRIKKLNDSLSERGLDLIFSLYEWIPFRKSIDLFKTDNVQFHRFPHFYKLSNSSSSDEFTLSDMLHLERKTFLVDHNLNYTDKMGMAAGVEIRVPFLDNDLVRFSESIPDGLKMKNGQPKYILKKVAESYLPNEIIYRKKSGFGGPVRKWISNDLSNRIASDLGKIHIDQQGIFNSAKISKLVDDNKSGRIDAAYPIWALLSIQSWLKQFTSRK